MATGDLFEYVISETYPIKKAPNKVPTSLIDAKSAIYYSLYFISFKNNGIHNRNAYVENFTHKNAIPYCRTPLTLSASKNPIL